MTELRVMEAISRSLEWAMTEREAGLIMRGVSPRQAIWCAAGRCPREDRERDLDHNRWYAWTMRAAFMGLVGELPDGWHDESTMTFTIPPIDVGEGQSLSPGNVVINWVDGSSAEAEDYLADLHRQLEESFESFETLEEGELAPSVPFIRFQFEAGRDLQQMLAVRRIGSRMVIVTGTAMGEYFDRYREQFVGVALSLKSA